ncbi:hypothetical protein FACS1894101_2770 [Betaproteobacteria bacterium]|nr:hypothetical protein FACS1894101_2770 [Betaproteobacteria bacterium]
MLTVKGNQSTLKKAIEQAFADDPDAPAYSYAENGHGRRIAQIAQVIPNNGQVDSSLWPDCQSLARIRSIRCEANKPEQFETRYYISSANFDSETLALAVRRHWAIENDLHWRLDVTLSEDACKVRRDHAPQNLSILRRMILNMLKIDAKANPLPKRSIRLRRKIAGFNDDERMRVLGIKPICV